MNRLPIGQRALSLLLSLALVLSIFSLDTAGAYAQENYTPTVLYLDSGNIVITENGYSVNGGEMIQQAATDSGYLITQNSGAEIDHSISVQSGTQDITLQNVKIDTVYGGCPFSIAKGAAVNLTLIGINTLQSDEDHAALEVPGDENNPAQNASLTIMEQSTGSLITEAESGAGIGGRSDNSDNACGCVTINGGSISVRSMRGAGIGGGYGSGEGNGGAGGHITINGGTVSADSLYGAGIGGGNCKGNFDSNDGILIHGGNAGDITINGGSVLAESMSGAGIGGGYGPMAGIGGAGGNIIISGGSVIAQGGYYSRDIGAGFNGDPIVPGGGPYGGEGTLTIAGPDAANGPTVELRSDGMLSKDEYYPTEPTVVNCTIKGGGAGDWNGVYDAAGNVRHIKGDVPDSSKSVYDANGKIKLCIVMQAIPPKQAGTPVLLKAYITADYLGKAAMPSGKISFTNNNIPLGNPVSVTQGGCAQISWMPTSGTAYSLKATYIPTANDCYASAESTAMLYTAGKVTSSGSTPTASSVTAASLIDVPTGTTVDLTGVTFPAGVTSVTLGESQQSASASSGSQAQNVFHMIITDTELNVIGIPVVYDLKLLDQNGHVITGFSGKVTVKIPVPAGLHGVPHVFRYEESTGTFTDMSAVVVNGFLVFSTEHFSYYTVAGVGDSVTLDTKSYSMPAGGKYQIGVKLTGTKAASVKVTSTSDKVAAAVRQKNGNVQVTAKGTGTAYIMTDVYDSKSHLLTHASVRVDVKTAIRPRGDATRQIGVF